MKPHYYLYSAVLLLILASCAEYVEPDLPPLTSSEISAARLWERMTVETDYQQYEYWPGHEGFNLGQSPHGALHKVQLNKVLSENVPLDVPEAPVGTIIVKENYTIDEEMVAITVMAKVEGYNPEGNDWFWARYGPDGSITAEGVLNGCVSCHAGAVGSDYIIIGQLSAD